MANKPRIKASVTAVAQELVDAATLNETFVEEELIEEETGTTGTTVLDTPDLAEDIVVPDEGTNKERLVAVLEGMGVEVHKSDTINVLLNKFEGKLINNYPPQRTDEEHIQGIAAHLRIASMPSNLTGLLDSLELLGE